MSQALIQRWEGFIAKIKGRLQELMEESDEGMAGLFEQYPHDYLPISAAMSGLDARIRVLRDKLQETWDEQVDEKFSEADIFDVGADMKADAEHEIDWTWAEWKARTTANYYRKLEPAARAAAAQPVHCTQCSAVVPRTRLETLTAETCPACGTINQIAPTPEMLTYFGGMSHAIADEQTVGLRREIEAFRIECDRWRRARDWAPEPLENYEKWERMERNFWETHTKIACELAGRPFDQALVDARMEQFIRYSLECEQVWVRAKGRVTGP